MLSVVRNQTTSRDVLSPLTEGRRGEAGIGPNCPRPIGAKGGFSTWTGSCQFSPRHQTRDSPTRFPRIPSCSKPSVKAGHPASANSCAEAIRVQVAALRFSLIASVSNLRWSNKSTVIPGAARIILAMRCPFETVVRKTCLIQLPGYPRCAWLRVLRSWSHLDADQPSL